MGAAGAELKPSNLPTACRGKLRLRLPSLGHRGAHFALQFTYRVEPLGMCHYPPRLGRLALVIVAMVMPLYLALPR